MAYSKDFPIDAGIFTTAKVSLGASTDANADQAIANNQPFPAGDIQVGHISITADTGSVSLKPAALPAGTSVTFDVSASASAGVGVYGKSSDAIAALNLSDPPSLSIPDVGGERYLLMDFGYSAALSASATQPIGVLGSATFGVDAKGDSTFAVLHRFDATRGANDVMAESFASWRLPRHVALVGADLNIKPKTWLIVELDGSLSLKLAATLGWNLNFAKELTVLGVTHDLSAKIDAGLTASLGFDVSGEYVLVVARENDSETVRLILSKQKTKGWNFGLNLNVGVQGADPQLPANFNDFISATFGVHGLQVLNDLQRWADPTNDLGQKIAGLIGGSVPSELESDLVQKVTGIPLATVLADFKSAKQVVTNALTQWSALPDKLSSMLWTYLGQETTPAAAADFKTFLTDLSTPATGATALATALQNATFGDTPQGQFLESIADNGLLALANDLPSVGIAANKVLNILNGSVIQQLQAYINQNLDLSQVTAAVNAADPSKVGAWLQNRLANFLDHSLNLADLKDIQTAITSLNTKIAGYYAKAVAAMTNKYSVTFASTYQSTTTDTALLDVLFDMSQPAAAAVFNKVVADSKLDGLLTATTAGVTLNLAKLTHDVNRKSTVDLNMPFFDFNKTSVNDAMVTLQAENLGSGLLLYQVSGQDIVTIANRASSQLSVLASMKVVPGQFPMLDSDGSISYELRQVKSAMRPVDLEAWSTPFIDTYLEGLFGGGDPASIRTFYTDLDNALTAATDSPSNFLGDVGLSMQLSLPASAISGWFQERTPSQLTSDQMTLSRALQGAWRRALPALYFQNLDNYIPSDAVAALLVWSSMPIAAGITLNNDGTLSVNTGKENFWDYPDVSLRNAVAGCSLTVAALSTQLAVIHGQLVEAGSSNTGFFDSSQTTKRISDALDSNGEIYLQSLLFTESQIISGATDALKQIGKALTAAGTAPTIAMKLLANFVAQLTDTFNRKISSAYIGIPDRVIGPMLLVEASAAVGSAGVPPAALMALYALNPGHTFNLGDFVTGAKPPKSDVALTQTLVSLS
jgi:hypothetical protein